MPPLDDGVIGMLAPVRSVGRPSRDPALEATLGRFAKSGDRTHLALAFHGMKAMAARRVGQRLPSQDVDDVAQGAIVKFIVRASNLPRSYLAWFDHIVDEEVDCAIAQREQDRRLRDFHRSARYCRGPADIESDVFAAEVYVVTRNLNREVRRVVDALFSEAAPRPTTESRRALLDTAALVRRRLLRPELVRARLGGAGKI